jgi:hypothetical protein
MKALSLELALKLVLDYHRNRCYKVVARENDVDWRTVKAYVGYHQKHGAVPVNRTVKRKPVVNEEAASKAAVLLAGGKHGTSAQVARELHKQGLLKRVVHRTTLARHAKAAAKAAGEVLRVERGQPKKGLTAQNEAARLEFSKKHRRRNFDTVMITDRKKFLFKHPGVKVSSVRWSLRGKPATAYTVNNPECVNMYAGLTKYGVTKAHLVVGTSRQPSKGYKNKKGAVARNITGAEYKDVLLQTLLPEGNRIFSSQGITSWVFQQDNDPTHKGAAAKAVPLFNGKHSTTVSLLAEWPPNSPDLSPIENLWAIVQRRVDAAGCKTFAEFKKTLQKEWDGVSKQLCSKLITGINTRLAECIKREGRRTDY